MEDIKECIDKCGITRFAIKKRALDYSRAGSDEVFKKNLDYILEDMF
jgi:hypothetical protein